MALALGAHGLVDPGQRQVGQRVGAQLGGDLARRAPVGDHLLARRHVDAVVAGMADRRRGDPHVDLGRARVAQHLHDLARRVAAHDRVVDDHEPPAAHDLGQRVELQPQAVLAQLLAGLDEGPRHVAVLDEAVVLGQAGRAREAARRGVAGVGHRDDEVGRRRGRLARQDLPHPPARGLQDVAAHARVGPREVDVLEDAEGLARALDDLARADAVLADRDELAGRDVAQPLGADDVEGARLGGDAVAVADHAQHERAHAGGVAEGVDALLGHDHRREGAVQARHDVGDRVLDVVGRVRGQQRGDDLGVRGRAEGDLALAQLGVELDGVDEVAVVGQRELAAVAAGAVAAMDGLGVLPLVGAGRRVADVADREVAAQRAQVVLLEHLRDEAERALGDDVAAVVGGRDPRGLLPAMLQRVQREVGEARDVVLGTVDPEHPALVPRSVALVEGWLAATAAERSSGVGRGYAGRRRGLAQPDARVQATQHARAPPVAVAQQRHQARHQQGPHDERIDEDGDHGPDADLLEEDDLRRGERAHGDGEQHRGRRDQPAGRADAAS